MEKAHHIAGVEAVVGVQFWGGVPPEEEIFVYEVDWAGPAMCQVSILIFDS